MPSYIAVLENLAFKFEIYVCTIVRILEAHLRPVNATIKSTSTSACARMYGMQQVIGFALRKCAPPTPHTHPVFLTQMYVLCSGVLLAVGVWPALPTALWYTVHDKLPVR